MKKIVLATAFALMAAPAFAHPGHGFAGFGSGLAHPLSGADHLLAMLAVGLWAGYALSRQVWAGAAAFLSAMVLGASLSWAGIALPFLETGITLSVVTFGALALVARPGQSTGLTTAALLAIFGFGLFHGHAHASEATGAAGAYLAGFLLSTAALHLAGVVLARGLASRRTLQLALGAGITGAGLLMMAG